MAPDPAHLDDPFDTSDELMAEAAAMEERAGRRRQDSIDEAHRQVTPEGIEHTTESRAVKLAEHEATLARAEAKEFRTRAVTLADQQSEMLTKADALEAAGDTAGASELREEALGMMEVAQRQVALAEAAEAAAAAADEQAKVHVARVETLTGTVTEHLERSGAEEKAADEMERSAGVMRNAGTQMTEAERLEAAAIDLRSRGVEGVERVDAAAKTARDEAEVLTLRAKQQDPSHSFGTADDFGIDQDLIEIEPNTPDAPDAPAATDDLGIDPNLIEIEPNTPDAPAATDDLGIDPNLIEIEPNTPDAPAATDDLGIDPDLIEIEPNASGDEAAGTSPGDSFSGPEERGAVDSFVDDGFEQSSVATQDFTTDSFDVEAGEGGGDFADSQATGGEGFDTDGGEGFEAEFEV
jgi:hypothetical protein